jgi:hypothetical protein
MLRSALYAVAAVPLISAAPPPAPTCEPAPVVIQTPTTAANSTYTSDGEPPKRFAMPPDKPVKVAFGGAAIDETCGRPPCNMIFEGCVRGGIVVLPDPFTTDSATFARIVRHELAHVRGWPASHGD